MKDTWKLQDGKDRQCRIEYTRQNLSVRKRRKFGKAPTAEWERKIIKSESATDKTSLNKKR